MDSDRILIGDLLFILLIVGSNFVMYFITRSWTKSGDSRWMSALKDTFSKPVENSSNKSMDELRKRIAELEGKDWNKE